MKRFATTRRIGVAATALALAAAFVATKGDVIDAFTSISPYTESLVPDDYEVKPLLSAGDTVPETSQPGKTYRMVGIPDGLGAYASGWNRVTVYMNHEFTNANVSEPTLGDAKQKGAFVSKWTLDRFGNVLSGERAFDTVYIDDTLVGPAAAEGNSTRPFGRFCSGSLAGPEQGFDRYIYFANEEGSGTAPNSPTLDGNGGLSVAIFDNEAHALTDLGRFPWENTLVQPNTGRWTVIMGMEDGPANLDPAAENSQIYMYVGYKSRKHGATVLERNGLVGGKLYVFASKDPAKNSELPFQNGTISGDWKEVVGADTLNQQQLDIASDNVGAMRFGRPEDGAFNPRNSNEYFFVTTGESTGANVLGRLYSLRLNPSDPTKTAKLTVMYNADQIIAAGGDIAISPDNIDVSDKYLMINEDGTASSRAVMAAKHRDGSIWRFKLNPWGGVDVDSAERIVELNPPGRDGAAVGPGVWETTGIIDTQSIFGAYIFGWFRLFDTETWLFNVQAHAPTAAPPTNTVEDGQLMLLVRNEQRHHDFRHFPFWFAWWR